VPVWACTRPHEPRNEMRGWRAWAAVPRSSQSARTRSTVAGSGGAHQTWFQEPASARRPSSVICTAATSISFVPTRIR
jgi:hypothetical protein